MRCKKNKIKSDEEEEEEEEEEQRNWISLVDQERSRVEWCISERVLGTFNDDISEELLVSLDRVSLVVVVRHVE